MDDLSVLIDEIRSLAECNRVLVSQFIDQQNESVELITLEQAAKLMGVKPSTLRHKRKQWGIGSTKHGMFLRSEILRKEINSYDGNVAIRNSLLKKLKSQRL